MSRLTPEEAEERECMAEDRARGKKEDALIESGIVERFLRGGCKSATFPGGQLLTRDEHKAICAHILYLQQQTDVGKDFITQYQRQVKDLTEQLADANKPSNAERELVKAVLALESEVYIGDRLLLNRAIIKAKAFPTPPQEPTT